MNKLAAVVNSLEHRNIKAIGMVTGERTAELENTRSIYLATNRKNPAVGEGLKQAGDSGLPSLVNIAHCTSEKVGLLLLLFYSLIFFKLACYIRRVLVARLGNWN